MKRACRPRRWLVLAVLAGALAACSAPTPDQSTAGAEEPSAATTFPAAAEPPTTPSAPRVEVINVSDAADDCFNGFREPDECAGVDMTVLDIGPAEVIPELAQDPAVQGRLVFAIEFAQELAGVEEFGVFLYFDLDGDPATGVHRTDLPGVERLIGGSPPTDETWTQDLTAGDYDAEIVRDESRLSLLIEGSRLMFAVDPSLLADTAGAAPDAFVVYIINARGITAEDYFNGEGSLHVPIPIAVADEVVAQLQQPGP